MKRGEENGRAKFAIGGLIPSYVLRDLAGVHYEDLFRLWLSLIFSCTYFVLSLLYLCEYVCFFVGSLKAPYSWLLGSTDLCVALAS